MTLANDEHVRRIQASVNTALASGARDLNEVCAYCLGADPRLVERVLRSMSIDLDAIAARSRIVDQRAGIARRWAGDFQARLPAPDPARSQWWFTLDTIEMLSHEVLERLQDQPPVFLGATTVAVHFAAMHMRQVLVLDADPDLIELLPKEITTPQTSPADFIQKRALVSTPIDARIYDAATPVPDELVQRSSLALIDPPWYPAELQRFIARASALVVENGFILCTLPGILTRPSILSERDELLQLLSAAGMEVVELRTQCLEYVVPSFEAAAFQSLPGFSGRPWRRGDLLVIQRKGAIAETTEGASSEVRAFYRDAREFRVFVDPAASTTELGVPLERVPSFDDNVSTRAFQSESIAVWTSTKRGFRAKDAKQLTIVLEAWQLAATEAEAIGRLVANGWHAMEARSLLQLLRRELDLPEDTSSVRRTPKEIVERNALVLSPWASRPQEREHPETGDGFRIEYQRDRDRVLWSQGLKKLANKTQVFPVENDDHLRQRLAHSIEVMQLAETIGASFGLDRDLIEAGALAHDIGHTPFGHAGEHALDSVLNTIKSDLGGFNHYEHGVDVVRWLEDTYQSPAAGGYRGLNLTPHVAECIFKHTFCHSGHRIGQRELWRKSKHQDIIPDSRCHLEGQAVRMADKISYLVSDLEDGIRMGVFAVDDLRGCRLFDRAPIDIRPSDTEPLLDRFISQRRAILQVLMEDVIMASGRRIAQCKSADDVRRANEYTIDHSSAIRADVAEVWRKLQAGMLHKHHRVVAANLRAGKMVSRLLVLFAIAPELIDRDFARSHRNLKHTTYLRWYRERSGASVSVPRTATAGLPLSHSIGVGLPDAEHYEVPIHDLVMAKDYVASLTDRRAMALYHSFFGSAPRR